MNRVKGISKILSRNDCGETGGHQAGILIPKTGDVLSFFPKLSNSEKNPRHVITFEDSFGVKWKLSFIYYNNKFFGGTRNEYRLTGMTKFFKAYNIKKDDELTLTRSDDGLYSMFFTKKDKKVKDNIEIIRLGHSWKVINLQNKK